MAELTNERLTELIRYLGCTSMEHGDGIYRALTELLERRKAEECNTCRGTKLVEGPPYADGQSDTFTCPDCHGTGKQGNAELPVEEIDFHHSLGEFDETWFSNCFVHIERMSDTTFWIGFDMPGDKRVMLNTGISKGVWFFNLEEDKIGGGAHASIQRPRAGKPVPFSRPINAELIAALRDVLSRIDNSDSWWMDCPDKGGFDADRIRAALERAEGKRV